MSGDLGESYLLLIAIYLVALGILFQSMGNRNLPTLLFVASLAFAMVSLLIRVSDGPTDHPDRQ